MKKVVAIFVVLILIVGAVACLVGCNADREQDKEPVATSYVSIDINPSMRFVLDENQKVTSYSCGNDAAIVLAYGEDFVGLDIQDASRKVVDLAIRMGYLTDDNCAVTVSVSSDSADEENNILDKMREAISQVDETTDVDILYDTQGSFILNCQLEKLKEKNPDNEYYQNLTAGKLRLINSAMAVDFSLKVNVAVTMSTEELLEIVDRAYGKLQNFSTKSFEQAKLVAEQAYQASVTSAQESVYLAKYTEYKGLIEGGLAVVEYKGLSIVAKSVELIAKGVTLAEDLTNKVLANEDVMAIAIDLGVDVNVLKDEAGNVTVDSIGAYVDKVAKNNADKMTQDLRERLVLAVDKLEKSKENLQDKPLSQEVVSKIKTLLESIEIKDIDFIDFTVQDLKDISVKLEKKASDVKAKMDASLTAEQKLSIEKAQQQAVDKLDGARAQYNQAVAKAEQSAKAFLQNAKQTRLEYLGQQAK